MSRIGKRLTPPTKLIALFCSVAAVTVDPLLAAASERRAALSGKAEVIDANTLKLAGRAVRLRDVHAPRRAKQCIRLLPEPRQSPAWGCGAAAADALSKRIRGRAVTCIHLSPNDRTVQNGRCYVYEGEKRIELNRWIVRQGWAAARPGAPDRLQLAERAAKREMRGQWTLTLSLNETQQSLCAPFTQRCFSLTKIFIAVRQFSKTKT